MTVLHIRVDPRESAARSGIRLDWFGRGGSSNVSGSIADLTRDFSIPDQRAVDLLRLAVGVFSADKVVLRSSQSDRWTRDFRVHIPVTAPDPWRASEPILADACSFLTGDRWAFRFRQSASPDTPESNDGPVSEPTAVCLFSGGLDSLAGAIDLLERGEVVVLMSHYDSNHLLPRQQVLYERLRAVYGDRVLHRPFLLRPLSGNAAQLDPLSTLREPTTRSRSILFMAAAGVTASACGLRAIVTPENGYFGLNVPLEVSRLGSCSTRTTHPHFIKLLATAIGGAGVDLELQNPFESKTKGEVIAECARLELLLRLAPLTISCAHPEVGRWGGEEYGNCGYCLPCLMRRSSLHHLGADDPSQYRIDVGEPAFLAGGSRTDHLRALIKSQRAEVSIGDVLRSGPIPRGRAGEFRALYERGRQEVQAWLAAAVPASR